MAAKDRQSKLHHYVPQGYLRAFANDRDQIRVVPLAASRTPFTTAVKNVAAQNHFHTTEEFEDEPDWFERALSGLEGEALRRIDGFERGAFPPSEEDRWGLSYFMALQSVRGPDTRRTLEHLQASMARLEIGAGGRQGVRAWIRRNLGVEPSPELEERIWAEATQPGGPPVSFRNSVHIEHTVETASELMPYFATRPWTLVRFDRRSLITSDAPVSLIRHPDVEDWQGVGFLTAWGIALPLTRKLGLLMSDPLIALEGLDADDPRVQERRALVLRGALDHIESGTTAHEKLFNEHTAHSAREYIYLHPEDERFIPPNLPEPNLINVHPMGSLIDMDFDGEPLFRPETPGGH
jgi:hypothetical protein